MGWDKFTQELIEGKTQLNENRDRDEQDREDRLAALDHDRNERQKGGTREKMAAKDAARSHPFNKIDQRMAQRHGQHQDQQVDPKQQHGNNLVNYHSQSHNYHKNKAMEHGNLAMNLRMGAGDQQDAK